MEEIGYRTTTFEFEGVSGSRREFISWLLKACAQDGVKLTDLMDADAIELLAERLRTALQIEMHLTLAFQHAFRLGERRVSAEIIEQVRLAARAARDGALGGPGRLSNVVFMGMGEPLANYPRVLAALRSLTDPSPYGLGLSQRNITVSTVGLVPAIHRLAGEGLAVTLAVSLHAPDDELRDTLVPVNTRWKVAEVLDAAWGYVEATGRRVSIEYAMIRDVNDQPERADLLADLLRGRLAHVNLIPLNPTPGSAWDASDAEVQREFVRRLRARGVPTTVRDTRGRDIDGACGQLAAATT